YIGHPLARAVGPSMSRTDFCAAAGVPVESRIVALLPGSRHGEVARHLPILMKAARLIRARPDVRFILALPAGFGFETTRLREPARVASIQILEGATWDTLARAELALAASGTVTVEAALLATPMVTFYKVNALTWYLGRWLVHAPYLTMVNL